MLINFSNNFEGFYEFSLKLVVDYNENHKTEEQQDDIKVMRKYIECCYKASIFTSNLIYHFLSRIGMHALRLFKETS